LAQRGDPAVCLEFAAEKITALRNQRAACTQRGPQGRKKGVRHTNERDLGKDPYSLREVEVRGGCEE